VPRMPAAVVWDSGRGVAYIFADVTGAPVELFKFQPPNTITKLNVTLPVSSFWMAQAFYAEETDEVIIVDAYQVLKFYPAEDRAEIVPVSNWPAWLHYFGAAYVPTLNRIYLLGGWGRYEDGDTNRDRDEIAYIQLRPVDEPISTTTTTERPDPVDCSDGATRLIPDPACCRSYFLCYGGEAIFHECPDGQYWNPNTEQCDDNENVRCRITYD